MSYIHTIHERDADGELAALYRRVGNPDGTVDNVMKVHALNPDSLRAHFDLYVQCMHRSSPLSRAEREMAAVEVSRINGCTYCLTHHHAGLRRLLEDSRGSHADALRDGDTSSLAPREQAIVAFAGKLTQTPAAMTDADLTPLRAADLDDRAILDLAQCVGYFNYVNRIVTALGVRVGEDEGPIGQWPEPANDQY